MGKASTGIFPVALQNFYSLNVLQCVHILLHIIGLQVKYLRIVVIYGFDRLFTQEEKYTYKKTDNVSDVLQCEGL